MLSPVIRAAAGLCLVVVAGCAGSSSNADEEERLEHHIPAHKPTSFARAIPELDRRFHDPALGAGTKRVDPRWSELADIVRWLPELAADSDLRRQDWERVQQLTGELSRHLQQWEAAAAERSRILAAVESILAELLPIAARSEDFPARIPEPAPGKATVPMSPAEPSPE